MAGNVKKPNGAASEDDLVIENEPAPEGAEIVVAPQEDAPVITGDPPPKEVSSEEGMEALKASLERERSGRLAAEARERDASARAASAGKETQETQLSLVTNAIEMLKQQGDALKGNYAAALRDGDHDGAADIMDQMADAKAKIQVMEQGKRQLEETAKAPPAVEKRAEADPVEALAVQLSPRSATWVRSHPEYARDPRLYQKMLAAHNLAMADGVEADSDDYFREIEGTLRIAPKPVAAAAESALSAAAAPAERRAAPPAVPPGRGGNGSVTTVRLSADEREMASMMNLTDQEYAQNKVALQKEGKLQ